MLQRLINDILEASSLSDGPTSIQDEDIDFAKEFNDMCIMLQQRVDGNVAFIRENPFSIFRTRLDKGRIAQMLINFVTNAVKFTRAGYIKVGYRYKDGELTVYCSDTGIGIAKDQQAIIFNRFVKLDEFVQGTGMGLAICKSVAERMGGQIGVDSEGAGKGSTFWVKLPCVCTSSEPA
jgi:signal transduction histidine kinase